MNYGADKNKAILCSHLPKADKQMGKRSSAEPSRPDINEPPEEQLPTIKWKEIGELHSSNFAPIGVKFVLPLRLKLIVEGGVSLKKGGDELVIEERQNYESVTYTIERAFLGKKPLDAIRFTFAGFPFSPRPIPVAKNASKGNKATKRAKKRK